MLKMGWRNSAILKIKAKISVSYEKTAKKISSHIGRRIKCFLLCLIIRCCKE